MHYALNALNFISLFQISSFDCFILDMRLTKIGLSIKCWTFFMFGQISHSLGSIDGLARYDNGLNLFMLNPMVFLFFCVSDNSFYKYINLQRSSETNYYEQAKRLNLKEIQSFRSFIIICFARSLQQRVAYFSVKFIGIFGSFFTTVIKFFLFE